MSGAAQNLLDGLLKQKNRPSEANTKLIALTPAEEYLSVMDALIEQFKTIEDWGKMPLGFYGARMLALKDGKCNGVFLAYLKTVPDKRWKKPIVTELEGLI